MTARGAQLFPHLTSTKIETVAHTRANVVSEPNANHWSYPEVCDFWRPSRETVEWLVILAMFCRRLVSGNNLSACLSSRHAYVQQAVGQMLHRLKFVTLEAEARGYDSCLPACLLHCAQQGPHIGGGLLRCRRVA